MSGSSTTITVTIDDEDTKHNAGTHFSCHHSIVSRATCLLYQQGLAMTPQRDVLCRKSPLQSTTAHGTDGNATVVVTTVMAVVTVTAAAAAAAAVVAVCLGDTATADDGARGSS